MMAGKSANMLPQVKNTRIIMMMNQLPESPADREHANQAEGLESKGNEHGHFAADEIREPAPEDAAGAIGDAAPGERRDNGRSAESARLLPTGEACAVIIRPPTEVSTKATYNTQKCGVANICPLLNCCVLRRIRGETGFLAAGETWKSGPGLCRTCAARMISKPCPMPV